jgi:hypothetical protein
VSTNFPGSTVGNDFDNLYTWDQAGQQWGPAALFLGGWDTPSAEGPALNPAEAVFYVNGGAAIPFTRSFTVQ